MRPQDRERIQVEVVSRVVDRFVRAASRAAEGHLEDLVNDTLYCERRRLEHDHGRRAREEGAFYDQLQKRMRHASSRDLRQLLEELARRFVAEIVGNFDERVYRLSTRAIPPGLWALLSAMSPRRLLSLDGFRRGPADHVEVKGEVDHVRALLEHGTLVVVPTHSSNLDSIIIGYTIYLLGLPPLTYGAGLNLFSNPLLSFFMRNLGAYRVDRRKSAALYKDVLKEYATCSMEMGYNNLFFPGGTRSRSGSVEQRLKLGLLGTTVRAYLNNLRAHRARPNLYVVPCTLSYQLVLEAETLIEDHLKETGKSRYIIEDDEFSQPRLVLNFLNKLLSLDSRIVVTFSAPLDPFGNRVDRQGRSLDAHGRLVDPRRYMMHGDEPVEDDQRDAQYTRELGDEIVRAFLRDNLVMSTHVVAGSLLHLLRRDNPELDLYRLLRTGGKVASYSLIDLHAEVERLVAALAARGDGPRLGWAPGSDASELVDDALKHFAIFHTRPAAVRHGDRVFHEDRNLLLYYGNRLRGYDLGRALATGSRAGSAPPMA